MKQRKGIKKNGKIGSDNMRKKRKQGKDKLYDKELRKEKNRKIS